jgi:DNA-binding PadR family transcriptional regulator
MEFKQSPTAHWSGSAGAIYPLVERLRRQRLLRADDHTTGRRRSRRYVLTPAGLKQLHAWLSPPFSDETAGLPPDPLRSRIRFLAVLSAEEQAAFLADAEAQGRQLLPRVEADIARYREIDPYAHWMARGAAAALRARLAWLREIAEELERLPRS